MSLVGAGCGSEEGREQGSTAPPASPRPAERTPPEPRVTAPSATAPPTDATPPPGGAEDRRKGPEAQPGGAGDEEAARSPADLTGRGGRIAPRIVRVPPFLAVRVSLRSADGRDYALRFGRRVLRAGGTLDLDGLRPGERLVGRPVGGARTPVTIEASAEPGP